MLFALAILTALLTLCSSCGEQRHAKDIAKKPPITVHVATARELGRPASDEVVGTVRPKMRSVISAKISGRIEEILAVPGQEVKGGELLLKLEAEDRAAKVQQAQAVHEQALRDMERATRLLSEHAMAQQNHDAAVATEGVARAALAEAKTMLGYAQIAAPFDGVVTQKYVEVGDLAAPGVPLLEVISRGALRLEAEIPETSFRSVKLGAVLSVRITGNAADIPAPVSEIVPTADPLSRTFLVKLDLPAMDQLFPGQFGRVTIPVGEVRALRVPEASLIRRGQLEMVYVAKDGRSQLRLVKSGRLVGDDVEMLSGIDAGEQVIIDKLAELADQHPIEIAN